MKIKIPSGLSFRKLLFNNRFVATVSVILSFSIWLVVMINRNPVREQTFTDLTANISIENTIVSEMGLGIVSDVSSQKFTVTVSGPNYIVSGLKPEDFLLSASVTDVNAAGTYSLEIIGTRNSNKSGYTFSSITPSTIDVTFDFIDTKEFTVVPKLVGIGATEGLIADTPILADSQQSTITIKGPRSVMDTIATVGAVATVDEKLSSTKSYDADIVLYDANEKVVYRYTADGSIYDANDNLISSNALTLDFTSVKVSQPISKKATFKVRPVFTNVPSGMSESDIPWSLDHTSVTVIGTPEVIDKIEEISLSAIDFKNISTATKPFEVSPVLPEGVKILDNIEYFTVTVNTSKYAEKVVTISDIRCTGLSSSLKMNSADRVRNVKICGPKSVIAALSASDLYASINLTDKSVGEHTVEIVVKSDKHNNIWQVGSYTTTIIISE